MSMEKPAGKPSLLARELMARGADYEDEGSGDRVIHHAYQDPLDVIWETCARQLGMTIARSDDVFASWDGTSILTLSTMRGFDPDDSLAQMVLHEICHALVQGPDAWSSVDWGLHNVDARDLSAEHAAQRVQAALASPYGLRSFVAVTTKWRSYYDALPEDPLSGPASEPAVPLARTAYARSRTEPWKGAIDTALRRTARLAAMLQPLVGPDSLWSVTTPGVESPSTRRGLLDE